jgi:hypothetical protein
VVYIWYQYVCTEILESLHALNRYMLYFLEDNPEHLDQDEIIEA